jgi:cytochrome c
MNRSILFVLPTLLALIGSNSSFAQSAATVDDAKAMAIRAAEFMRANGEEKALAAFNTKAEGFADRDLYVFVDDKEGTVRASGGTPGLVGRNNIDLKDVDGKMFVRDVVGSKEPGWVDYKWRNVVSNKIEERRAYIVPVGNLFVGVAAAK